MLDLLAKVANEAQQEHPHLLLTTHLLDGSASAALFDAARSAQLLVVGPRGSGRFAGLWTGSIATHVAGLSWCPVVILRGDEPSDNGPIVVGTDGSSGSRTAADAAFA